MLLNAWLNWQSVSNQHFRIYYHKGWDGEAINAIQTLEHYRPRVERLTGGSKLHVPIMIEDLGNEVNGYTDVLNTKIAVFAYPPTSGELAAGEDWWQMVATHEYIHMLQMTRESGIPMLLRIGFSNFFYPELWQPGWMTEGITVYGESRLSQYSGRLKGGTYHPIISVLAKNDKMPSRTKAAYFSYDTPQANYYVFGGAFFEYLANHYGESQFSQLYARNSSSTLAYLNGETPAVNLDPAYRMTYGKSLDSLWNDWISFEKRQQYNLPTRNFTADGWFKSNLQVAGKKLYYVAGKADKTGPNSSFFSYKLYQTDIPSSVVVRDKLHPNVIENNQAHLEVLVEQSADFPAGYQIYKGKLYYSRSELRRGFANNEMDGLGSVVEIWQQDLTGGNRRKLCHGQIRAFLPMPDGSLLTSEDNETHTASILYKIQPDAKLKSVYYKSNMLIHTILANGNNLILGAKANWQNSSIYSFDLRTKALLPVIDTPYYETPVSYSGDNIIFNAVYDGKMGAYIYNLTTTFCYKFTNVSDIRTPVLLPDNRELFISISPNGYDIYQDKLTQTQFNIPLDATPAPPVRTVKSGSRVPSQYAVSGTAGTYLANIGHMLVPRILHLPIIEGTQDSMAYGASLSGGDVVGDFPSWSATVVYDTKFAKYKYALALQNNFLRPIKHVIGYSNDDAKSLSSVQYVSLLKRQNYGLQDVITGFSFLTKDDYQRKILTPFLELDLGWASGNLSARQFVPIEKETLIKSNRERMGWQSYLQYHQKLLLSSELKATAFIANDTGADLTEVFGSIRGYDHEFKSNQGAVFQANIYKPLIKIRDGIWNPQIYMEDVCLGLYYDAAIPYKGDWTPAQSSQGVEVLTELGLAFNLRLSLGIRYSYNKEKVTTSEVFVNTLF